MLQIDLDNASLAASQNRYALQDCEVALQARKAELDEEQLEYRALQEEIRFERDRREEADNHAEFSMKQIQELINEKTDDQEWL